MSCVMNKVIALIILAIQFSGSVIAQKGRDIDLELTLNAIEAVLSNIYADKDFNSDWEVYIFSELRYRVAGPEIERLNSICMFCDWINAPDTMDIPRGWAPKISKNIRHRFILTDIPNREDNFNHHFFSPLIPTKIKKYFAIQCNSYQYGERQYRLIMLRKKGKRFEFVTDIYSKFTVY